MPSLRIALIAAGLALLAALPAFADTPAGQAVAVDPQATGKLEGAGKPLPMEPGDGVFMGQTVITGNTGEVQIVFSDDTHLVVGPGSELVISEYLMRNDGSLTKFVIDALSGTFRFLTGDGRKDAYEIDTPYGQIGVRGTAFDLTVDRGAEKASLLLYHGGVSLCGAAGCKILTEACAVGIMARHEGTRLVAHADGRRSRLLAGFLYLKAQGSLGRGFRIADANACRSTKIDPLPEAVQLHRNHPPTNLPAVPGR